MASGKSRSECPGDKDSSQRGGHFKNIVVKRDGGRQIPDRAKTSDGKNKRVPGPKDHGMHMSQVNLHEQHTSSTPRDREQDRRYLGGSPAGEAAAALRCGDCGPNDGKVVPEVCVWCAPWRVGGEGLCSCTSTGTVRRLFRRQSSDRTQAGRKDFGRSTWKMPLGSQDGRGRESVSTSKPTRKPNKNRNLASNNCASLSKRK